MRELLKEADETHLSFHTGSHIGLLHNGGQCDAQVHSRARHDDLRGEGKTGGAEGGQRRSKGALLQPKVSERTSVIAKAKPCLAPSREEGRPRTRRFIV